MKFSRMQLACFAILLLWVVNLHGQDLTGSWQGLIEGKFRVVLEVTKNADGKLQGNLRRVDQSPHSIPVTTLSIDGPNLKFAVAALNVAYEGTLSNDGKTITGTLASGQATPLISVPRHFRYSVEAVFVATRSSDDFCRGWGPPGGA